MKRSILTFLLALVTLTAFAQSDAKRLLTGVVDDTEGEVLIGATVLVDGTNIGALTDADGKFSLSVPKDKTLKLIVKYVGFVTRTVSVAPNVSELKIRLEESVGEMNEVVVIGYGTAKKSSLTASVETIKGEDLQKIPAMNLDQSLQGQVAGLGVSITTADPSSAKESRISVRGNTGNPLLVIDGIPRLGTNTNDGEMRLSDLNPDDIESVSILK
ncbi:MAG: carboxypeptidase-like regulatory domain-containing protein, partial [Bacteroidaceae bacterium]|nr:carboxypeptidase-like regulatory domain-containing protein [Bacteroidaceae bacterium]